MAFLERYLNNASPTGFETPGQKMWLEYLRPYIDTYEVDNYGTCYGIINPGTDYRVVIEAHADEIAWFVNHIGDDGILHVCRNGGSDHMIAPSKRVNVHTRKNGIVQGIFGWPAIHVRTPGKDDPTPSVENIFIDLGAANKQEVLDMGVTVGSVITYPDEFFVMNGKYFVGRALDNRAGGFCIAEVARLLKENNVKLPFTLYIVNAVQEEIGLRGAEMVARKIKPHVAIVTDVTHDTSTPLMNAKRDGDVKCGKGPAVTYAPAVHNNLLNLVIDTAEEKEIPLQREARHRATGTDTDAFAYSNDGTPSVLISLPLRYMHTTVETVHREDVENVIKLIYESLLKIEHGHDFRYFK